jgi:GTP-binding protein
MSILHQTRFATTVNEMNTLPSGSFPEVAFVGRSNSGKSSTINLLCNQKRLAFTSKLPGRTQHINFFKVEPINKTTREPELRAYLVDLPGYGFARVERTMKAHWDQLLGRYMAVRESLKGLVIIMDIRHPFTEIDIAMIEWFKPRNIPVHVILNKSDKLSRNELSNAKFAIQKQIKGYEWPMVTMQHLSCFSKEGLAQLDAQVLTWLDLSPPTPIKTDAKPI